MGNRFAETWAIIRWVLVTVAWCAWAWVLLDVIDFLAAHRNAILPGIVSILLGMVTYFVYRRWRPARRQ